MKKLTALLCLILFSITIFFYFNDPISKDFLLAEQQAKPLFNHQQVLPHSQSIDRLVVFKTERQMWAYQGNKLIKIYPISLGGNPIGHKQFEGDKKTPEGIYRINERNANSGYHKNLGISYPNKSDREYAALQGKSAGGLIKIHGLRNGIGFLGKIHLQLDWTNGCIAVTNEEMDELFHSVVHNAIIDIRP